jgi:hypothetical protein
MVCRGCDEERKEEENKWFVKDEEGFLELLLRVGKVLLE